MWRPRHIHPYPRTVDHFEFEEPMELLTALMNSIFCITVIADKVCSWSAAAGRLLVYSCMFDFISQQDWPL